MYSYITFIHNKSVTSNIFFMPNENVCFAKISANAKKKYTITAFVCDRLSMVC